MTKYQKAKLEKLLHEACVLRDGGKCVRCGRTTTLQASHIYPKGTYQRMRYLLINLKTLCYRCHLFFWHKHPVAAAEWLKTALPAKRLKKLKELSQQTLPPLNYEEIKKTLEKEIAKHKRPLWRVTRLFKNLFN